MKKLLKTAFLKSVPVMAGYVVLGIGFGILAVKNGISIWWAAAMSVFIYAGSMQYMAVSLLTSGAGLISVALTTLMVNARHLFYSFSMLRPYKHTGRKKPYLIFGLTDETYSLVCDGGSRPTRYYALVTLLDHLYWVGGTALGALLGSVVPIPTEGIDFALTALFVTIAVEQWKARGGRLPAVIGLAASVVCLLVFGPAHFLIPAMLLITAALLLLRRVRREEGDGRA
jgi:4-azaleucine resistance transporter AzlC